MARSFLVPINLNSLELQNFVVHNVANDPTGIAGRLYYNSTDNVLKFYKGGASAAWQTIATGGSAITIGTTSINIGATATTIEGLTLGASSTWNGNTIGVAYGGTGTATGSITGTGALTFTAGGSNQNVNLRPTGTGSVDLGSTNGTDGFKLTGLKDPTNDYDATNKKYVDGVAAGLNAHPAVNYATTGALGTTGNLLGGTITTTYANGTSGVGATLTIATSTNWTDILIDGQNVVVADRILIKNQGGTSSNLQNGIYVVTSVGTVGTSTSFVFTRAADSNTTPEVGPGDTTYVLAGSKNGGNGFVQTATIVAIGTTPIAWSQFSGSSTTTAGLGLITNGTNPNQIDVNPGTGLTIASDTIALANTAVTAGSYGTSNAIPGITVDAQGRITGVLSQAVGNLAAVAISSGQIAPAQGGTGANLSSVNQYGLPYFSTAAGVMASTAAGASTQVLIGNASGAPSWTNISGLTVSAATSATNATNTAITDDTTTNATMYPTWVTTTTGNLPQKVSSTKLSFNPSTGTLTSTVFAGSGASLTSIPAANVTGTLTSTVLGNSAVFIGTTSVALNRTTANQALTGITSITGGTGTTDLDFFTAAVTGAASGAIDLITGATTTSGTTGAIIIRSGNSAAASGTLTLSTGTSTGAASGAISIDTGATSGGTTGAITIGTTSASALTIGRSGVTTSLVGGTTATLGKTTLAVHATGYAALNIPSAATVVSSPASGDLWNLSGVLQFNTGAATKQIAFTDGNITGSAATAGSVTNSLVIKGDAGTTEGTDLYTFNGSVSKTLNFASGTGVTIAETSGTFTFNNSGVTSLNGSTGALGATANSNGSYTRYHRATSAAALTTAINHGLGQWVLVQVYKTSDGTIADVDVTNTSTSGGTTTVGFATAPGAGDYTIVIIG